MQSVLKWFFLAVVSVLILCVVLVALAVTLCLWLLARLTGRKPPVFAHVGRMRAFSEQFRAGTWRAGTPAADVADVVDVQAHEIKPAAARVQVLEVVSKPE